jgi:excisionase family DNA binding protein
VVVHERLITGRELADYLQVSPRTVERWRYEGGGPQFVKAGRHCRYRIADVEEWLTQRAASAR